MVPPFLTLILTDLSEETAGEKVILAANVGRIPLTYATGYLQELSADFHTGSTPSLLGSMVRSSSDDPSMNLLIGKSPANPTSLTVAAGFCGGCGAGGGGGGGSAGV